MTRISAVRGVSVNEVGLGSIFLAGDCITVRPRSAALAIQRQTAVFNGSEGSFQAFPIYSRPIPLPAADDSVRFTVTNAGRFIHVGAVDIISVSSSSVLQIGSNEDICTESRVKHIRQLHTRPGT